LDAKFFISNLPFLIGHSFSYNKYAISISMTLKID
jgi:hypothetical protein